jgi:hypothetical protein
VTGSYRLLSANAYCQHSRSADLCRFRRSLVDRVTYTSTPRSVCPLKAARLMSSMAKVWTAISLKSIFLVTQEVIGGRRKRKWGESSTCLRLRHRRAVLWERTTCIEGRNHWTDAFLRLRIRPRGHHGKRHRSCTD